MRKSGKRPLAECLRENNGPPATKRSRSTQESELQPEPAPPQRQPPPPPSRRRRRRRTRQSVQNQSQAQILERGQERKRHINSVDATCEESGIEIDENDITELSLRLKKARLRPSVFFYISSFIEQTVDDVTVNLGDDETNYGDGTNTTSTFTFVLPLPTPGAAFGYRHSSHCDSDVTHEEEA